MSIATEITRLQAAKADIAEAIEAKGVTVPGNTRISDFALYINSIPMGDVNVLGAKGIGTYIRVVETNVNAIYQIAGFNAHGEDTVTLVRWRLYGTSLTVAATSMYGSGKTSYNGSTADTYCNSTIYNRITGNVKDRMINAPIKHAVGSNVYTIQRYCFLPAFGEVGLAGTDDGDPLPLFNVDNVSRQYTDNKLTGQAFSSWLTRTMYTTSNVRGVLGQGSGTNLSPTTAAALLPMIVLSADTPLSDYINSDGSYEVL